jgi:NADH dehydrogenase
MFTSAREPVAGVLERTAEPAPGVPPLAELSSSVATAPHRVVIVGGGAGGLVLATKLGRRLDKSGKARITLVDSALTHVWKPLLHEVAAGTLRVDTDGLDYFAHARAHGFAFELGHMRGLDRTRREITLDPVTDASGTEIVPGRRLA